MEKSPHVLLVGQGAEDFALEQGVRLVPREYFRTAPRQQQLEQMRQAQQKKAGGGTVGAVALDRAGHLAAATSTGGLANKHRGRVGDSPLIGAGTYADESCAVSGTGDGEYYIRQVVAHDICALTEYRRLPLAEAVRQVIHEKLKRTGGEGGVIALDRSGAIAMDFNSVGMFRGARDSRGRRELAMYRDSR
jgi:beta-aspartyl-peptidase (threonine type)